MISLQIIKRDGKYVVQIGKRKLFSRKLKWIDMHQHYINLQKDKTVGGYMPMPATVFSNRGMAESFCEDYLKDMKVTHDHIIRTYNTGPDDMFWPAPPMPDKPTNPPKKK